MKLSINTISGVRNAIKSIDETAIRIKQKPNSILSTLEKTYNGITKCYVYFEVFKKIILPGTKLDDFLAIKANDLVFKMRLNVTGCFEGDIIFDTYKTDGTRMKIIKGHVPPK